MSLQGISTGTTPNDGTGDPLINGAKKINDNFQEIYDALGDGTNLMAGNPTMDVGFIIGIGGSFTGVVTATSSDIDFLNSIGGSFTGVVTATSFVGNGSSLTGLTHSQVGAIPDLISDGTPQLGGNLDINNYDINGVGNININGSITGNSFSGSLGDDLDLDSNDIIGSGNINITGVITATTFDGALKGLPQNTQTSAYTLVVGDAGKNVAITTGGVTLNTGVFDPGDAVSIYNDSEYTQMINVGSGVTMRRVSVGDTGDRGLNQYGLATIMCIRNDEFVISGSGLT